jgi:16S rRNA (guanine527-N7)-methyltransferase
MTPSEPADRDDLAQRLRSGARQLELPIDDAQVEQLLAYLANLDRWNGVHSLSAWKSQADFLVHHIFDSMTLVGPLIRFGENRPLRILDGVGPRFPAVLASMRPDWSLTAVDAVAKKTPHSPGGDRSWITNLVGLHARLEILCLRRPNVVSRAFGSLDTFAAQTHHPLAGRGFG